MDTGRFSVLTRLRSVGVRGKIALFFYLLAVIAVGTVGGYGYRQASIAHTDKAQGLVWGYTNETGKNISSFFDIVHDDVRSLSQHFSLLRHLYAQDLKEFQQMDLWKHATADEFISYVTHDRHVREIRFLDRQGRETIEIRRHPVTREVTLSREEELEDVSFQEEFRRAMALEPGGVVVSSLDYDKDRGTVRMPLLPVVRIATPVYGANKVKYGVLVNTLLADGFLDYIRSAMHNLQGSTFHLIDTSGRTLFPIGQGEPFAALHPGLLERIQDREMGSLSHRDQIIAFQRVHPHPTDRQQDWILVGAVPQSVALKDLRDFKELFGALTLGLLALIWLVARFYLDRLMRPLLFVTRQIRMLGQGAYVREEIVYKGKDELRWMLDSTERLTRNLGELADLADAIARGDYAREVPLLSDNDRLGSALGNMTRQLRENREQERRRTWHQEGIERLNRMLAADLKPQEVAEQAIGMLGRYLEAGRGVFYLFDPESRALDLLGSYMYTQRTRLGNRFRLGEGAVGQAALEKQPILLTVPEEDPPPITTGLTSRPPLFTCTWPLLREGEVLGVIELASFQGFDDPQRAFLAAAADVIVSFLFVALQRERIRALLAEAEEARRVAQERTEQATRANVTLEIQQQKLQQQTEELRQTNAQMEEQQQQLQQQTEELQQANSQMERQQARLLHQAEELAGKNRALSLSQGDLNRKAKQLEASNRYKSEFLANMSHELRTPLNSIILLSNMMRLNEDGRLDDTSVRQVQVIHEAGSELLRLINDILDLSALESGKSRPHLEPVHSGEVLDEQRSLFQAVAREKGLELHMEDTLQATLTTDRHKLSQVLRNLLSNACKFTPRGRVSLTIRPGEDPQLPVVMEVSDTGIGIPPEKQELIFEEFQQADGSISRRFGGTGLGLSISRKFVVLLGGRLSLHSQEGEGSRFVLHLPLHLAPAPDEPSDEEPVATPLPSPPEEPAFDLEDDRNALDPGEHPILIIDDEASFCRTVILLNHRLGKKTVAARSGEEGLELAARFRPAGIILDLGLPDMDGMEVLAQLKRSEALHAIPVYVVSGRDREGVPDGALGYLRKPVSDKAIVLAEELFAGLPAAAGSAPVLIVEGEHLRAEMVEERFRDPPVRIVTVAGAQEALREASGTRFGVAVVDARLSGGVPSLELCDRLKTMDPELFLIVYCGATLDEDEEARLRGLTDSLIQESPQAGQRLLRDVERFLSRLPREPRQTRPGVLPMPASSEQTSLAGHTLMVVDDDPRNLFVVSAALESKGAKVVTAISGAKALERLALHPVDLILMDIMMPGMDGYETISRIRQLPGCEKLPILVLTAKAFREDRERCLACGANDYLAKPADYEILVNMVKLWLERAA
ncbi:MAG: response regulator [Magnetococcales bacterium]|nr:response regulator [Magnetococcales bacterium]